MIAAVLQVDDGEHLIYCPTIVPPEVGHVFHLQEPPVSIKVVEIADTWREPRKDERQAARYWQLYEGRGVRVCPGCEDELGEQDGVRCVTCVENEQARPGRRRKQ